MTELRRLELSQGTWGWDRTKRFWVPPQYAGVKVDIDPFADWKPSPVQLGPFYSTARGVNMCASRRGGKTHTGGRVVGRRILLDAHRVLADEDAHTTRDAFDRWFVQTIGPPGQPRPNELFAETLKKRHAPLTYWAIGPDRELARLQAREISAIFERELVADVLGARWFGHTFWILALGARIDLKTGEHPHKLVGDSLSGMWLGEAARLKPGVWENAAPACDDRKGWFVTDTTPRGRNWYYSTLWAKGDAVVAEELGNPGLRDPAWENFHWTARDNWALPHLAEEMEKARKTYGEKSRHYIENYAASFATPEGMVWPQLDRHVHLRRVDESLFEDRVGAVDWGFSGSAGCMGFAGILPDGSWHWYRAHYHHGLLDAPADGRDVISSPTWAGFALQEYARVEDRFVIYGGTDRPDSIAKLRQAGIRIGKADTSPGSIIDSCATVEAMLVFDPQSHDFRSRRPLMTFDPDLPPEFIADVWGYEWEVDTLGRPTGKPSKHPDRHAADVVRYAAHSSRDRIRWSAIGKLSLRR